MTVIVADARRGIIAADTLMSFEEKVAGYCMKIWKNRRGELAGARGEAWACTEFADWFMRGRRGRCPVEWPDYSMGMVLTRKREILTYEDELPEPIITPHWWAIGSGSPYAMAAMDLGHTVEEAVRQAMKWSLTCGGEVTTLTLD